MSESQPHKTIQVECPQCNTNGTVPADKLKGGETKIKCKNCGHSFLYNSERRIYYRKRPLPMARLGPMSVDFDKLHELAYILDLSMTGMKLQADLDPADKFINIRFNLPPRDETVNVGGEVVWVKPLEGGGYSFGVQFTHVDAHSKKILGFYLMR